MDYVEGASLAELRRELASHGRTIDARVAVRIALDMLEGLGAAHSLRDDTGRPLRIIHRDVSPHNVLVGTDGRARLADFGIAKAEDRIQTTRTHEVKGKLAYLAPERVDKRRLCTVQSDVFSAGLVLWECFAGRRLFRSEQVVDLLQEVMTAPIPKLAEIGANVPRALDEAIARALSRDLEERYASAEGFARAVADAVGPEGIGERADVARLIEAIFGERLAGRQERVRATVGSGALADLLRSSGLESRPGDAPRVDPPNVLAELAPAAPTGPSPYVIGSQGESRAPQRALRPRTLAPLMALLAGIAVGVAGTWSGKRTAQRALLDPRAASAERSVSSSGDPSAHTPDSSPARESASPAPTVAPDRESAERIQQPASPVRRPTVRVPTSVGTLRNGFTKLN
jgi:serine/threonine-protein kinase